MITTPEHARLADYLSQPRTLLQVAIFLDRCDRCAAYRLRTLKQRGYNLIVTHAPGKAAHYQVISAEAQKEQE